MTDQPPQDFTARLAEAIDHVGTPLCVGLDPVLERLPAEITGPGLAPGEAISVFCRRVLDALVGTVGVVKPQAACFERFGHAGVRALEEVCGHARELGFVVILDAKRGDIGSSAAHYAAGARALGADAITVNGYLGTETIRPFLDEGLGVFVLVRTSNPGGDQVQSPRLESGETVAEHLAACVAALGRERVGARGLSQVGAVVGATSAGEGVGRRLREIMPDQVFLVPGVGAQGGSPEDVRPLARAAPRTLGEAGVVVNASRSVLYPGEAGRPWSDAIRDGARRLGGQLAEVVGGTAGRRA